MIETIKWYSIEITFAVQVALLVMLGIGLTEYVENNRQEAVAQVVVDVEQVESVGTLADIVQELQSAGIEVKVPSEYRSKAYTLGVTAEYIHPHYIPK